MLFCFFFSVEKSDRACIEQLTSIAQPNNFAFGLDRYCNKLYLIDFGLAKKYRDTRTNEQGSEPQTFLESKNFICENF